MHTPEFFNQIGKNHLPEHLGIVITEIKSGEVRAEFTVKPQLLAPNGFFARRQRHHPGGYLRGLRLCCEHA